MALLMFQRLVPGKLGRMNRCFARFEDDPPGGPGRFLPSAIMLDHPGQRLKVLDGPNVEPRRLSEHFLPGV